LADNPKASLVVSFADRPEEDPFASRDALSLALDHAKNLAVYGSEKTVFAPGEYAYLVAFGVAGPFRTHCSAGEVRQLVRNVMYPMSEVLEFAFEKTAQLSHTPAGAVSYSWLGKSAGSPLFSGRDVRITQTGVYILKCEYVIAGNRVRLFLNSSDMSGETEMGVTVAAVDSRGVATASVNYAVPEEVAPEEDLVPVDIKVIDACTEEPIAGASVTVDGQLMGISDDNGLVSCGMMLSGTTHTLVITASGYLDSEADDLCNDTFTVP
jgi:hypothetical protein